MELMGRLLAAIKESTLSLVATLKSHDKLKATKIVFNPEILSQTQPPFHSYADFGNGTITPLHA